MPAAVAKDADDAMWFDDWSSLASIVAKALIGFVGLVFLVRIGGKRLLAKLNAFDLVVSFTVGSLLASMILSSQVAVVEGLLALTVLVALAAATSFLASRSRGFRTLIKSQPTLLVYDGDYLRANMRRERIAEVEIAAVMRNHGVHDLADVKAMVLETEGDISVLRRDGDGKAGSLSISGIDIPGRPADGTK